MKEYAHRPTALDALRWDTKMVYSAFLVTCLLSYVVMGALIATRTQLSPAALTEYYVGDEEEERYGKTVGELLETTHFHLFSVPLLLFVQGHLFLFVSWRPALKAGIVTASFVAAVGYIATPWLIVYGGPLFAYPGVFFRLALAAVLIVYAVVPLWEMWRPGAGAARMPPFAG